MKQPRRTALTSPVVAQAAAPAASLAAALAASLAVALTAGCVTINIYFPAAAAEKAADRIIDEIYQIRKDEAASTAPAASSPAPAAKPAETK